MSGCNQRQRTTNKYNVRHTFRIDEVTNDLLEDICRKTGCKKGAVVRYALKQFINKLEQ